jgi:uncharacterized protein
VSDKILILPGWQNSGPHHWQSLWEAAHGYERVAQHDWLRPLRGDWIARLEDAVLSASEPTQAPQAVTLVAHSLGCVLVAAWASVSRNTHLVACAMLVAPGDVEREDVREMLPSWSPVVRQTLPFPSLLLACRNDPYCSFERAQGFAKSWGSTFVDYGDRGHINTESGLGVWPDGYNMLLKLQQNCRVAA